MDNIFDFSVLTNWIDTTLSSFMPEWLTVVTECVLIGVVLLTLYSVLALFYIYFERKVCAAFQCRIGPNRVGPWGLLQSVADMFKILIKELITLKHVDKFLFSLARLHGLGLIRPGLLLGLFCAAKMVGSSFCMIWSILE